MADATGTPVVATDLDDTVDQLAASDFYVVVEILREQAKSLPDDLGNACKTLWDALARAGTLRTEVLVTTNYHPQQQFEFITKLATVLVEDLQKLEPIYAKVGPCLYAEAAGTTSAHFTALVFVRSVAAIFERLSERNAGRLEAGVVQSKFNLIRDSIASVAQPRTEELKKEMFVEAAKAEKARLTHAKDEAVALPIESSDFKWGFEPGLAQLGSVSFEVTEAQRKILELLATGRGAVTLDQMLNAITADDDPDCGPNRETVRTHLTNLRNVLRKAFSLRKADNPIPNCERSSNSSWRLDVEMLKQ